MEFNTQPTPDGGVPGDYPGKTKPSKGWIGDLPGQGSEGPTDIPNKDDSCPTCGATHSRGEPVGGTPLGYSDSPAKYINPNNSVADPQKYYRGEQQGRGGHFGAGASGHKVGLDGNPSNRQFPIIDNRNEPEDTGSGNDFPTRHLY